MKIPDSVECPDFIPEFVLESSEHLLDVMEIRGVVSRRHPNGGGWVDETADVDPEVRVTRNASVRGLSVVTGNVCISGDSKIVDSDIIGDDSPNGLKVVASIVEYSRIERNSEMSRGALSVVSASMLLRSELTNPRLVHDEDFRDITL